MEYKYKYGHIPNIGTKFNRWTVIDNTVIMIGKEPRRSRAVTCKCECGSVKVVRLLGLFSGMSKGCSCIGGIMKKKKAQGESVGMLSRTQFAYFRNCATRRDISWELTMEFLWDLFIKQNSKCALSGIELSLEVKIPRKNKTNNASLDRIDSMKSYTEDNVQWVHKDINKMKSNLTDERFIELCNYVSKYRIK